MFAVDQAGRVVGQVGFDQASGIENFELGGYPVVADALHGWVRDDSWVLGGRIYRVVGRPVENDVDANARGRHHRRSHSRRRFRARALQTYRRGDRVLRQRCARLVGRARRLRHRAARHHHQRSQRARRRSHLQGQGLLRRAHASTTTSAWSTRAWSAKHGTWVPAMRSRAPRTSSARRSAFCTTPTTRTSARCRWRSFCCSRSLLVAGSGSL